ncbi:nuclear transport factor 2 family protein [Marinomonas sp. PE14-40]|uniref:nuclear transport factor 2 family protein n=1 Tax=Marinomonas sp. PE14-40 TaxID=3060621 RepID=UPI003F666ECC
MPDNKQVLTTFYEAFQKLDFQTMASCYHKDAEFRDEVFDLKGEEINAMWHMLCKKATSFNLTFSFEESNSHLTVTWQANYLFSQTGRPVENKITANFEFKDGKIIKHRDSFDFWRWSRQALGLPGYLMGWSPFLRTKVRKMANQNLTKFIKANQN